MPSEQRLFVDCHSSCFADAFVAAPWLVAASCVDDSFPQLAVEESSALAYRLVAEALRLVPSEASAPSCYREGWLVSCCAEQV